MAVRRKAAYVVRIPGVPLTLGLLDPHHAPRRSADDIQPAITIEVRVFEIETGHAGTVNADGPLSKIQGAVAGIFKDDKARFTTGTHHNIRITIAVDINGFGVLRNTVVPENLYLPTVALQRIAMERVKLNRC